MARNGKQKQWPIIRYPEGAHVVWQGFTCNHCKCWSVSYTPLFHRRATLTPPLHGLITPPHTQPLTDTPPSCSSLPLSKYTTLRSFLHNQLNSRPFCIDVFFNCTFTIWPCATQGYYSFAFNYFVIPFNFFSPPLFNFSVILVNFSSFLHF